MKTDEYGNASITVALIGVAAKVLIAPPIWAASGLLCAVAAVATYGLLYGAVDIARRPLAYIERPAESFGAVYGAVSDRVGDVIEFVFPPVTVSAVQPGRDLASDVEPYLDPRQIIAARMALSTYLVQVPGGWGSGVRISDTEVLTARHVMDGADMASVRTILGSSWIASASYDGGPSLDYAVLRVSPEAPGLVSPVDCREPVPGEPVTHIGNPGATRFGVQFGAISQIDVYPDDGSQEVEMVMTVNPGSSGGPVFDADGELIGIVTASLNTPDGKSGAFSMMLPTSVLCPVLGISQ